MLKMHYAIVPEIPGFERCENPQQGLFNQNKSKRHGSRLLFGYKIAPYSYVSSFSWRGIWVDYVSQALKWSFQIHCFLIGHFHRARATLLLSDGNCPYVTEKEHGRKVMGLKVVCAAASRQLHRYSIQEGFIFFDSQCDRFFLFTVWADLNVFKKGNLCQKKKKSCSQWEVKPKEHSVLEHYTEMIKGWPKCVIVKRGVEHGEESSPTAERRLRINVHIYTVLNLENIQRERL